MPRTRSTPPVESLGLPGDDEVHQVRRRCRDPEPVGAPRGPGRGPGNDGDDANEETGDQRVPLLLQQQVSQSRTLCGKLDLSGTATLQDNEAVHDDPGDAGQNDDAAPARQTDGGRNGGEVGDPQPFDPGRHP